jgi:ADP-ribosylglycohydrolase
MRVAPVGLIDADDPFRLGADIAAITHGHPSGYLSAGCLAFVVDRLLRGESLSSAIAEARGALAAWPRHEECLAAVDAAVNLANEGQPSAEKVESLGGGWVGEEALAIALYSALVARDYADGVRLAVNHSGDSDSTGSLVGNLLGVIHGRAAIPPRWLEILELRAEIEALAGDLYQCFHGGEWSSESTREKYPGW